MKVLIACEESQTVCKAFRARGHEAYSCDIQEPSGGKPEWHILKSGNTKSCGCLPKQSRLPNNRGVINHIILQYKRHARDRGLAWGLSYEDVERLIQQPCFYCGTINSNHKVTKNCKEGYDHNGIDRTDSSRGYFIDNVVPCCKICNRAKNNMDQREFIEWARKVTNHTVCLPMAEQWG